MPYKSFDSFHLQRICKACRDESEVRGLLEELWKIPSNGEKLLADAVEKNRDVRKVL